LLEEVGIDSLECCPLSPIARTVSATVLSTVRTLAEELRRTLRFLKADLSLEPERLVLLGGGASIRHIGLHMEEMTELETVNWTFPVEGAEGYADPRDAVFAAAFAAAVVGGAP
jgi:hypothetical protein